MVSCYIIYSQSIDTFYVGITQESIEFRLAKHNAGTYGTHFTSQAKDWELFLLLPCDSVSQSMKIERHIKKMKSRGNLFV
ncbi:MAG: GIY-YIG nuclease family protein [Chitinophagaceae bacterium]|nr:GIY-YIG nuclease family protein [Chitinophagaceae bacterium]MCW5915274.1 GIY-YIG nuclease family protein [Chitinophagaceae bacterium]